MLIKKLNRKTIKDYSNKDKYEILGRFVYLKRYFYIVSPKNIISKKVYVVPEFIIRLSRDERNMLRNHLRKENRFRGRHYLILC